MTREQWGIGRQPERHHTMEWSFAEFHANE